MGGIFSSSSPKVETKNQQFIKNNPQSTKLLVQDREYVFENIIKISNELIKEFNKEYLKEDFCNKMVIVYQKKFSKLNIELLRNMYNQINSNKTNRLLMTLKLNNNIPKFPL